MEHKIQFERACLIGRDPAADGKGSDASFYDWIAGQDEEKTVGEFLKWFLDELHEETDAAQMEELLVDWKQHFESKHFEEMLTLLDQLMPPQHPFHILKTKFRNAT
jgi:hypothetical protein